MGLSLFGEKFEKKKYDLDQNVVKNTCNWKSGEVCSGSQELFGFTIQTGT
jgi:hypothetical protein